MIEVKATPKFMRLAGKAMTKEALQLLIEILAVDPGKGIIIKDTGGIRKIRWSTGKSGRKSGGLRVLYYYDGKHLVLLITFFKKADQENIDLNEKNALRKLITELIGG